MSNLSSNPLNQNETERIVDWLNESLGESKRTMAKKIVDQIIKQKPVESLEKVRDGIAMARKPKMRVVEHYLCDNCDVVISGPEQGYIIHGNIYVADPNERGGLIGNNFPKEEDGSLIKSTDVKETVLCKSCFIKAIALNGNSEQTKINRKPLIVTTNEQSINQTRKLAESILRENAADSDIARVFRRTHTEIQRQGGVDNEGVPF